METYRKLIYPAILCAATAPLIWINWGQAHPAVLIVLGVMGAVLTVAAIRGRRLSPHFQSGLRGKAIGVGMLGILTWAFLDRWSTSIVIMFITCIWAVFGATRPAEQPVQADQAPAASPST